MKLRVGVKCIVKYTNTNYQSQHHNTVHNLCYHSFCCSYILHRRPSWWRERLRRTVPIGSTPLFCALALLPVSVCRLASCPRPSPCGCVLACILLASAEHCLFYCDDPLHRHTSGHRIRTQACSQPTVCTVQIMAAVAWWSLISLRVDVRLICRSSPATARPPPSTRPSARSPCPASVHSPPRPPRPPRNLPPPARPSAPSMAATAAPTTRPLPTTEGTPNTTPPQPHHTIAHAHHMCAAHWLTYRPSTSLLSSPQARHLLAGADRRAGHARTDVLPRCDADGHTKEILGNGQDSHTRQEEEEWRAVGGRRVDRQRQCEKGKCTTVGDMVSESGGVI